MRFRSFSMAAVLLFVMGCSLFDSGMPWESGPYALLWIDLPDEVQLSYDLGRGSWATLVGPRVFAVGANQEYVVAQQHPGGDKTIANFFIIEVQAGAKATSNMESSARSESRKFMKRRQRCGCPRSPKHWSLCGEPA